MKNTTRRLFMIGAFPPPLHGMSAVNAEVKCMLQRDGVLVEYIDTSAKTLSRSVVGRMARVPWVALAILRFVLKREVYKCPLYMSVSGGFGQFYELIFAMLARFRGMRLCMHHHSFSYLSQPTILARVLIWCAGEHAIHVTQSPGMSDRVRALYGAKTVVAVSNVVFLQRNEQTSSINNGATPQRKAIRRLGYLSNIAEEKGVLEFLELMQAIGDIYPEMVGVLAGPFQDAMIERKVRERLKQVSNVQYVGAKYGSDKDAFFASIDVFIFPTRYKNETEGIVNHEALSWGVPVIAYGRGCIPEIITSASGKVINPNESFVSQALEQIKVWRDDKNAFAGASLAAMERYSQLYAEYDTRWWQLVDKLVGCKSVAGAASIRDGGEQSSEKFS